MMRDQATAQVQTKNEPGTAGQAAYGVCDPRFENRPIRLILPKKGRLTAIFDAVMNQADLGVSRADARHDFGRLQDQTRTEKPEIDTEALFMRGGDALRTLAAGVADMAVIGRDMLDEFNEAAAGNNVIGTQDYRVEPLGLASCSLYIAVPVEKADFYQQQRAFDGCRVATSFPGLVQKWARQNGIENIQIVPCEGGVEDMVRLGLADIVCDIVETGKSLVANGLVPCVEILRSEALLVTRAQGISPGRDAILRGLEERIAGSARGYGPQAAKKPELMVL